VAALQPKIKSESADTFGIMQQQLSLLQQQQQQQQQHHQRQGSPNATSTGVGISGTSVDASLPPESAGPSSSSVAAVASFHAQLQLQHQQQLAAQLTALQHQLMMLQGLPGLMQPPQSSNATVQLGLFFFLNNRKVDTAAIQSYSSSCVEDLKPGSR
jgi:hypothetical protein